MAVDGENSHRGAEGANQTNELRGHLRYGEHWFYTNRSWYCGLLESQASSCLSDKAKKHGEPLYSEMLMGCKSEQEIEELEELSSVASFSKKASLPNALAAVCLSWELQNECRRQDSTLPHGLNILVGRETKASKTISQVSKTMSITS